MQTNNIVIMFHTHTSWARAHNTRSGLHTFFGTVQYRKQIIRRAIILCVVAGIFLLVGSILTWLAFRDIFGNRVTGPVFLGLALIIVLLAVQRFVKAKKHVSQSDNPDQTVGVVLEDNAGDGGAITVIMDSLQVTGSWRDPDIGDNIAPPSYIEATDSSCLEPPSIEPEIHIGENEAPPSYEEAIEESQHSMSDIDLRQPG